MAHISPLSHRHQMTRFMTSNIFMPHNMVANLEFVASCGNFALTMERIHIPQERYHWALQRAGLTVESYICGHPKTRLPQWLNGESCPTIRQLEDFANNVHVPFGYLFLDSAPKEAVPFPVFRGEAGQNDHFDLNVYDTVSAIQQRQDWLAEYLPDNDFAPCPIVGCVTTETPILETVSKLRKLLNLEKSWALGLASPEAAVSKMNEALEEAGVFLAYNGVVGNNTHRPLKVDDCRGFALVNNIAPYIFVNSADAPTAQLFTLVHETVHLMLGVSAGHAGEDVPSHNDIERYCDKVAAEFLVPAIELQATWNGDWTQVARKFRVSEVVVVRRAHELRLLADDAYASFWTEYRNRPQYKKNSSGGSFYRTSVRRVGRLFAIHVRNAVGTRQLSYSEAYRLTGLYGNTYTHFMDNNI